MFGRETAGHVHGLGINPSDGALFIATHTGLFRAEPGEERAQPVGDARQDTMGFTIVGPDEFVGSGHPDARADLPPLLGLIRSQDAGRSWDQVSLSGEADFHVLRTSGDRLYGFDATSGALMVSDDGGSSWARRRPPSALYDLAIDPSDPDRVLATSGRGLAISNDAGETWRPVDQRRAGLLVWGQRGVVLVDGAGTVQRSSDDGRSWERVGEVGGQPAALVQHGDEMYLALHTNEIWVSRDGGRSWQLRVQA